MPNDEKHHPVPQSGASGWYHAPGVVVGHRPLPQQGRKAMQEGRCPKPSVIRKLKIFQAYAKIIYFLKENPTSQSNLQGGVLRFF